MHHASHPPGGNCPRHCSDCRLRQTDAFTPVTPQQLAFIESFRSGVLSVSAGAAVIREHTPNG